MLSPTQTSPNTGALDSLSTPFHSANSTGKASHSKSAGRWTKEEHQKFVEALQLFGKNWKQVEDHVGTRSGAQIRSHAQKFFNRLEKEYKTKLDTSNLQTSQQIRDSLRKISETSTTTSFIHEEVMEETKAQETISKNPVELISAKGRIADFGSPASRSTLFHETQSVPPESPKNNAFVGFRRAPRKMSEDLLARKNPISIFEVMLSKIRTAKNGFDFQLSDLVDFSFGSKPKLTTASTDFTHMDLKDRIIAPETSSFRVNPRKFSEDNILLTNNMHKLRKESFESISEFEVLTKKIKLA